MIRRLILGFVVAALGACGPVAARRGNTVLFASGADLQSINPLITVHPLARQVQRYLLLTTLVRYDSALTIEPYLARSWAWSPDRTLLTFRLHSAVRWHDGRPTTAHDAAWTLDAARMSATGYPRLTELGAVTDVRALNDSTLTIRFTLPQSVMPDVLTDLAILPRHLLERVPLAALRRAEWNQRPVGNGPFRFETHEPNRRWVFTRNADFPAPLGGPPRLERFIIVVVDEPTTKLAALTAGELDFAGILPAHASFVRGDPNLTVLDYPLLFTHGIVFNTRRAPFGDLLVRRAVASALDRRQVVDGFLYGFGTPASGPVPPGVSGHVGGSPARPREPREVAGPAGRATTVKPVAANRDAPSSVLSGQKSFELLTVGSGEAPLEQMVQAQLARAGFAVSIRQLELSAFLDRVYGVRADFDAAVLGIAGDLGLNYLAPLARLSGIGAPDDPAAAQRLFADSMPVAFIYHARGVQGMNRRVRGVAMDVRGELAGVHEWWVEE